MRKHSGIVIALVTIMTCQMFSLTACGSSLQSNEESLPDLQNEDNIIVSEFIEPSKELNDRMNDISFDFETKTVTLNSGYEMPILGLGTYSLLDDTAVESVAYALENGGRLVDTASFYRNEESVGDGIRQSGIPRVKRDNISYNISLPVRRAIFLQVLKKPCFMGFPAHFIFLYSKLNTHTVVEIFQAQSWRWLYRYTRTPFEKHNARKNNR